MTDSSESLLSQVTSHFQSQGWDFRDLDQFRMEYVPGNDGGGSDPSGGQGFSTGGQQDSGNNDSLSAGFLQNVAPEHKPIVEQYVKQWDAGVTKRFQDLHSQYAPYQELGDVETLQQAMGLFQALSENPEQVIAAIQEAMGEGQQPVEQGLENQNGLQESDFQGLPPEFMSRFEQQEKVIEALANFVLGNHEQMQQVQEDQELDDLLNNMKQQHGEFDEDFVLVKMLQGASEEQAIQAWQALMQNQQAQIAQNMQRVPPVLQGGGSVPGQQQQKMGDVPRKDVQKFVAGMLQQAAAQQG